MSGEKTSPDTKSASYKACLIDKALVGVFSTTIHVKTTEIANKEGRDEDENSK
ncbi:hypothetical protein KSX_31810 [Ktedonospora formicarum]|uniref:Uncharacterized protein n=1 Tax=Ktedonospora formicarum TaxID=2778364 RepID=A0A8J3I2V2_9CHLR|nr:hypothetical protein KSX_31810 [Ktedonospora formicarum]